MVARDDHPPQQRRDDLGRALTRQPLRCALNAGTADDPHVQNFLTTEIPMRRWADPSELTAAALLLTGPDASYVTGAVLPVDGGWTAH